MILLSLHASLIVFDVAVRAPFGWLSFKLSPDITDTSLIIDA